MRIETNGSWPVYSLDEIREYTDKPELLQLNYTLDMKCPDSGMAGHNIEQSNFEQLGHGDEIKFVVGSQNDLDFAMNLIRRNATIFSTTGVVLNFSPVHGRINPTVIVDTLKNNTEFFAAYGLSTRLSLQIHKIIWNSSTRGV